MDQPSTPWWRFTRSRLADIALFVAMLAAAQVLAQLALWAYRPAEEQRYQCHPASDTQGVHAADHRLLCERER